MSPRVRGLPQVVPLVLVSLGFSGRAGAPAQPCWQGAAWGQELVSQGLLFVPGWWGIAVLACLALSLKSPHNFHFPLKAGFWKFSLRPLKNILLKHSSQINSLFPDLHHGSNALEQLNKMFIPVSEVHSDLGVSNDIPRINCTAQHWNTTTVQRLFGNLLSDKKSSFAILASEFILALLYHKWDTYMPSFWALQNTSGSELVLKTQPMYP